MYRTKKDVDQHVFGILNKIRNENERNLRGYTFAKMYFLVQDYECAKRYLAGFLSLKERDAAAHKLMGQIYEKTRHLEKALQSYKRCLELQENQKDVVLKICELYCETPVDPERARYWADRAESLFPNHEIVFKLRECIVTADGEQNSQELEDLIAAELAKRPRDVSLRIKLIKLYLDTERAQEAYEHAISVESRRPFTDNLDWYYCLTDTFEVYLEECGGNLSTEFYINALNAFDRLVYLCLDEKVKKNQFSSQMNHVTSVADCTSALHSFDQTLKNAWQLPEPREGFWAEFLNHMRGQLFFHLGTLILKKAKKDPTRSNMKEACRMTSALFLAAYTFKAPDLHSSWFVQANDTKKKEYTLLYKEACFRLSQTGHVILGLCREDRCKWLQKVRQHICTPQGKEKIYQKIFNTREGHLVASSYFMEDTTLLEFIPEFPDVKTLQDYDETAHLLFPDSLHHAVWLALQYYTVKQNVQPDYKFQIFSGLQFSVNNLSAASPESLCQLDIDSFLNATVYTSALCLEERNKASFIGSETPTFFPVSISIPLCTEEQSEWWTAAYMLFKNLAKEKLGELRRTLQHGMEVVRVLGIHGLDVNLIIHLAETFAERARDVKEQNENESWRHLEDRAALYWNVAISMLERLNNNQTCVMPKKRLFATPRRDLPMEEVKKLLEYGRFFLACQSMNANKNEEALEAFDTLKSPYASYYQALIFKKLAADEYNQPRELITSEMRSKHIILLTRARDALYVTLDRLHGNRKHALNQVLSSEIEDIETKLARIDPDMAQRHDFDGLSDECLSSQDSEEQEVESSRQGTTHNLTRKSHTTPQVMLSLRHDSPDQQQISRHREEHIRPSPERLDAQLRFLTHTHETVLKTFVEQNKTVMETNKHIVDQLKQINNRLEDIQKQVTLNRSRLRSTSSRGRGGVSNRGGVAKQQQQQQHPIPSHLQPEANIPPQHEVEEENEEDFYEGYYYEDEDYQDPNGEAIYQDYAYNSRYKYPEPLQNEYPYGHVTGLHGTSTVTYAPPPNASRGLLGQPSTAYPGYYQPSPTVAIPPPPPPQGVLPPGYFGASGHTISAGLPFAEGQKLPEFNFNPSLLPLQTNSSTPQVKGSVFSRLGTADQESGDGNNINTSSFLTPVVSTNVTVTSSGGKQSSVPHAFQITMPTTPTLSMTSPFQGGELVPAQSPTTPKSVDKTDKSANEDLEEDETGSDFKPLIPLPDEIEVRTGEEEEKIMFEERAKLFRFVGKEWKERGIGVVKILSNELTGKCRILMRRDQVWKICANHFVTAEMNLAPLKNQEVAWVWAAQDFADEKMQTEQFCIRFKTKEIADKFKVEFDKAKTMFKSSKTIPQENESKIALGFGDRFKPKTGSWECKVCLVNNAADKSCCVACETPKESVKTDNSANLLSKFGVSEKTASSSKTEPAFKFGFPATVDKIVSSTQTSTSTTSGFVFGSTSNSFTSTPASFVFKNGSENADKSGQKFVFGSPQTISPNKLGGGFVFGASALKTSEPEVKSTTPTISYGGFTFTSSPTIKPVIEEKVVTKEKTTSTAKSTTKSTTSEKVDASKPDGPVKSPFAGFSFTPYKPEADKQEVTSSTPEKENKPKIVGKNLFAILSEEAKEDKEKNVGKGEFLFSSLAKADSGAFQKDPEFKGFQGFGDSVFNPKTGENVDSEYEPQVDFAPVIPLPELVEVKTGEEDDDKLFGERARLYRFDATSGQWKERGTGELKVLKSRTTGSCRVLMRREQVHKVCANHRIEHFMQLASHSLSERSWTWAAQDFSEGVGVSEKFAVRFKTQDQANAFRDVFEKCVKEALVRKNEGDKVKSTEDKGGRKGGGRDLSVPLSQMFKPSEGSWECSVCLVRNDGSKKKCDACETPKDGSGGDEVERARGVVDTSTAGPKFLFDTKSSGGGFKFGSVTSTPSTTTTATNVFQFGSASTFVFDKPEDKLKSEEKVDEIDKSDTTDKTDTEVGFKFGSPQAFTFSFSGVRPKSPNKTPKSPQADKNVGSPGSADESVTEDEADHIYFQPVIPLPERVEVKTGEEDEEVVYCQRAKLFRLVDNEWKERGLGDMKILRHKESKKIRLLMRREQIHKVCLNHYLSKDLKIVAKDDKSWLWVATDFADNEPCKEVFTLRLKNPEIAKQFMDAIEKAKKSLEEDVEQSVSEVKESEDEEKHDLSKTEDSSTTSNETSGFSFRMDGVSPNSTPGGVFSFGSKFGNTFGNGSSTSSLFGGTSMVFGGAKPKDEFVKDKDDTDLEIVYVKEATPDQREKARQLQLPVDFYLYEDKPPCAGCRGCDDENWSFSSISDKSVKTQDSSTADFEIVDEPKAEPDQVKHALDLGLPPNFYLYEKKPTCPGCRGCEDEEKGDCKKIEKVEKVQSEKKEETLFLRDPGVDFASIAKQGSTNFSTTPSSNFSFEGVGEKLFSSQRNTSKTKDEDDDDDDDNDDASSSHQQKEIHFDPIVPLPDLVEVKTGEEDEDKIYSQRAKLYRFDAVKKEWKERGVGEAKILKHKQTNRFRLILRREQVYKIACNHYITPEITLNPLMTSETAWCWFAMDFADDTPTVEQFAIKFKTVELAKEFKRVFEECQRNVTDNKKEMEETDSSVIAETTVEEEEENVRKDEREVSTDTCRNDEEEEEDDDDDDDEDDDDDDEDDGDSVMFEKRITLGRKDTIRGQYTGVGMGSLRVLYDDDFYGARVQVVCDDGSLVCNHLIAMQTTLNVDGKNCFWAAEDYSGETPIYRHFQATFISPLAAKEFEETFNEGKEYAKHSDIWERPFNPAGGDNASDNGTATKSNAIKTCSPEISAALEEIIRGSQ